MAVPVFTVDAAFGSSPGAAAFTWTRIHTSDGQGTIRQLSYGRGRQNELARVETGAGNLVVNDPNSDLDPNNTSGRYYPNVRPYVPIRAQATIAGVTYDLFQHYMLRLPRTARIASTYTERAIGTVDGFEWLARAGVAGKTYSSEASGTRVANVLNDVGWSSTLRDLDAGQLTLAAATFAADDETKALNHLLDVAESENGLLFVDGSGRVAFVDRHALITAPYTTSQATFSDAVVGVGFSFVDSEPSYDLDTTLNEWRGTRAGGTTKIAIDSTSQGLYGVRTQPFDSLASTDADVDGQAQWKLSLFKDPLNRIESITVMPGNSTSFWQTVLGLEVGERITVKEKPPGFSVSTSTDYTIQRISVQMAGAAAATRFTFGLWPATINNWMILDDAVAGKFDTGKFAY